MTDSAYTSALRFRCLTPFYDAIVRATTRERAFKKALIRQASIQPGHHVLDVGSGTGTLAVWVKQRQPLAVVSGVDGDSAILSIAIRKAQKANVQVHFTEALSYNLPYPDAHFDRVVSSLFFHHLTWEQKQTTAHEIHRILKPGSELHVADWGLPANALMRCLFLSVQILDGFNNTRDNLSGRLIKLFLQAGFSSVHQRRQFNTMHGTLTLYSASKPGETSSTDGNSTVEVAVR